MTERGRVYYFISETVVHNDKVLPIILALAEQGHVVETVPVSDDAARQLDVLGSYGTWIRSRTRIRHFPTGGGRIWRKCVRMIWFVRLITVHVIRSGYLAFFDSRVKAPYMRLLIRIARWRGSAIAYSPWYLDPLAAAIDWEAVYRNAELRRQMGKRHLTPPVPTPPDTYSALLQYHPDALRKSTDLLRDRDIVMPHPKLQPWWRAFLAAHPPSYDPPELAGLDRWITVFLTYRGNYIFRKDSDLDVLLLEILAGIRRVFPDIPIVLKPKDSILYIQREWFTDFLRVHADARTFVSNSPPALLAERAMCGITTGHTTAQFEWMVSEAPWIEYCRYSDLWTSIYPQKTYTPQYGGAWVETSDALERMLRNLDHHRGDRKRFEELLAFKEVPLSFDLFTKSA